MTFRDAPAASQADERARPTLRGLSPVQWKSGLAAWLGLLFDGLDAYLYVLVATPFVALLMNLEQQDPAVARVGGTIQAAFLLGWAVGGTVFGWIGDRFGRARTMSYTILLFGICTGLSTFSTHWGQLLVLRFLVGMGIGGEWAAGSALISETWPRAWRPWVSAALWSAYEVGMLVASVTGMVLADKPQYVFLVGALPAVAVFWIRRSIPEPAEWRAARTQAGAALPRIGDLFRGDLARRTVRVTALCALAIMNAWLFLYWYPQQLRNLPALADWSPTARTRYVSATFFATTVAALIGNFAVAALAHRYGYRRALAAMFAGSLVCLLATYGLMHGPAAIVFWLSATNFFVLGVFGIFPLYIPPLFPTLLRTTGAGFSYNVGRVMTSAGLIVFGLLAPVGDHGRALLWVAALYVPLIALAFALPEHERSADVDTA